MYFWSIQLRRPRQSRLQTPPLALTRSGTQDESLVVEAPMVGAPVVGAPLDECVV